MGRAVPSNGRESKTVNVPGLLYDEVVLIAKIQDIPINSFVEAGIRHYLRSLRSKPEFRKMCADYITAEERRLHDLKVDLGMAE